MLTRHKMARYFEMIKEMDVVILCRINDVVYISKSLETECTRLILNNISLASSLSKPSDDISKMSVLLQKLSFLISLVQNLLVEK